MIQSQIFCPGPKYKEMMKKDKKCLPCLRKQLFHILLCFGNGNVALSGTLGLMLTVA